jgi:hypothetical protein
MRQPVNQYRVIKSRIDEQTRKQNERGKGRYAFCDRSPALQTSRLAYKQARRQAG